MDMTMATASFGDISGSGFELPPKEVLFGGSRKMHDVRASLEKIAGTNVPILIQGPSGTGKEFLSRYIHERSAWGSGAFVKVNCPAIPGTLFESELFGYQKGAFTGAYVSKPGRVEMANRGTLFLDEIAELEPGMQAKLLQVLQDGQFSRIGGQEERQIQVRVICATNRQLEEEIRAGTFRQDLFFRINVVTVQLPALKDRKEDIPLLIDYFLERYAQQFRRPMSRPSKHMMNVFENYHWPGNIRQLENLIKRFLILGQEEAVLHGMLAPEQDISDPEFKIPNAPVSLKELTRQAVRSLEKRVILNMLEANHWNRRVVSRTLGISYAALLYKMRQAGVPARGARRDAESDALRPAPYA
jgi:two-component system, NtrC family, response regulator AtoC